MALTLDIPSETIERLQSAARAKGQEVSQYIVAAIVEATERDSEPLNYTATELMAMPREERRRIMRLQAEAARPLYEADLALPMHERELTALTALEDPVQEPEEYLSRVGQ